MKKYQLILCVVLVSSLWASFAVADDFQPMDFEPYASPSADTGSVFDTYGFQPTASAAQQFEPYAFDPSTANTGGGAQTFEPYSMNAYPSPGGGSTFEPYTFQPNTVAKNDFEPYSFQANDFQPNTFEAYPSTKNDFEPYDFQANDFQPYDFQAYDFEPYASGSGVNCDNCGGLSTGGYTGPYSQGQTTAAPYYGGGTYGSGSGYGNGGSNGGLTRPVSVMSGNSSASARAYASASSYAPAVRVGQTIGYGAGYSNASAYASAYASASNYGLRTTDYGLAPMTPGIFVGTGGRYDASMGIDAGPYLEPSHPYRDVAFADPYAKYKAQPDYLSNRTKTSTKHDQFTLGSLPYTGVDSDILTYLLYAIMAAAAVAIVVKGMVQYAESAYL